MRLRFIDGVLLAVLLFFIFAYSIADNNRAELRYLQVEKTKLEIERLKYELSIYKEQESAK